MNKYECIVLVVFLVGLATFACISVYIEHQRPCVEVPHAK